MLSKKRLALWLAVAAFTLASVGLASFGLRAAEHLRSALESSQTRDPLALVARLQHESLAVGLLGAALVVSICWLLWSRDRKRVARVVAALERVADGDLDLDLGLDVDLGGGLGQIAEGLDKAVSRMKSNMESLHRARTLVHHAPVNFVCCDERFVVRYLNPLCEQAFAKLGDAIPASIVGAEIDFLFDEPAAMRAVMSDPARMPYRTLCEIGGELLDVSIDPLFASDGVLIGTLLTIEIVTEKHANQKRLQQAVTTERETAEQLHVAAERERIIADRDRAMAEGLRERADQILSVVRAASEGDLTRRVALQGEDPMARVARALDDLIDDLRQRVLSLDGLTLELGGSSERLGRVSQNLIDGAERTSQEAAAVSGAWQAANDGIGAIAKQIDGFKDGFHGVARNASAAVEVAALAVGAADVAQGAVEHLGQSSKSIDRVLQAIDEIADQSRLLALNASIEAARAGAAGRGFAVVAREVKQLANRTEEATRQIGETVREIRGRTERAVQAIGEITTVISRIEEGQRNVADTVRQHARASDEIGLGAESSKAAAAVIATSIAELAKVAEATAADAELTDQAGRGLVGVAGQIREITRHFAC